MPDKEFDTSNTDYIICPYCGHKLIDSWEFPDHGDADCPECEKVFFFERQTSVTYTSCKKK